MGVAERYYRIGQNVTWTDMVKTHPDYVSLSETRGNGPFRIVEVEHVPAKCNCWFNAKTGEHQSNCDVAVVAGAGHEQWVFIETPKGMEKVSGLLVALASE